MAGLETHEFTTYEVKGSVAVISLNRPDKANSQHHPLLHELDGLWQKAIDDDDVRVIIMRGNGRHFSAGHDLTGFQDPKLDKMREEGRYDLAVHYRAETKVFLGYTLGWRNCPKPTIAAVQGKCMAAGLMLCWPCDLIIAADNAEFADPVLRMALVGIEYHAHAWEFGARKAKEMLLTGRTMKAEEAERIGMVNKVVPLAQLDDEALAWANEIAKLDPFMASMAKRTVNSTLDIQGFTTAIQANFDLHELSHGIHYSRPAKEGPSTLEMMRSANKEIAEKQG